MLPESTKKEACEGWPWPSAAVTVMTCDCALTLPGVASDQDQVPSAFCTTVPAEALRVTLEPDQVPVLTAVLPPGTTRSV